MTKFKYAPKGIPTIEMTKEEFEEWERKINAPPTEAEKRLAQEADEIYRKIKRR